VLCCCLMSAAKANLTLCLSLSRLVGHDERIASVEEQRRHARLEVLSTNDVELEQEVCARSSSTCVHPRHRARSNPWPRRQRRARGGASGCGHWPVRVPCLPAISPNCTRQLAVAERDVLEVGAWRRQSRSTPMDSSRSARGSIGMKVESSAGAGCSHSPSPHCSPAAEAG
jgi:hypothetical protein